MNSEDRFTRQRGAAKWLLPYGIAMSLMAAGFTFDSGGVTWLWSASPAFAVVLAAVGMTCIAIAAVHRSQAARRRQ